MSHLVFSPADRDKILLRMADLATETKGKGIVVVLMAEPTETADGVEYKAEASIFKAEGIPAAEVISTIDVFTESYIHQCLASGELTPGFE